MAYTETPEAEKMKKRAEQHAAEMAQQARQWDMNEDHAFSNHGIRLQSLSKRLEAYFNKYLMGGGHLWRMGAYVEDDLPDRQIYGWRVFNPSAHLPLPENMPEEDRWTPQKMMELGVREVNGAIMFGRENIICVQRLDFREKMIARQRKQYQEQFKRKKEGPDGGAGSDEFDVQLEESQVEVRPTGNRRPRKPRKPRAKRQRK
jgi:hypothetical protein